MSENLLPLTDEELKIVGYALSNYRATAHEIAFDPGMRELTSEECKIRKSWRETGEVCEVLRKRVGKMQNDKRIKELNE